MANIEINHNQSTRSEPTTAAHAAAKQTLDQLNLAEQKLGLAESLGLDDRRLMYSRTRRIRNATLEAVAMMAEKNDGHVAGVAVDPAAVREAIIFAAAMEPLAGAAETFARRVRDDVLRKRYEVVTRVEAAIAALERLGRLGSTGLKNDLATLRTVAPPRRRSKRAATAASPVTTPVVTPK